VARARNLKPGFFHDADLVELPVETRLLFTGLWTIADREGRLEDKPKQIKMEIYPADSFDVNAMLQQLHDSKHILRYEAEGKRYIQVVKFSQHQNPHKDERASTIPAPILHGANPADSLNPITDSLNPIKNPSRTRSAKSENEPDPVFDEAYEAYPRRPGMNRQDARKAWNARLADKTEAQAMLAGTRRYAAYCAAVGQQPQFIKLPATFFGPSKHFESEWTIPPPTGVPRNSRDEERRQTLEGLTGRGQKHDPPTRERDITAEAERIT
jgi:hypothetical protein